MSTQPLEFEWPLKIAEPSIIDGWDTIIESSPPSSLADDFSCLSYPIVCSDTTAATSPNVTWFTPLLPPDDEVDGIYVRKLCVQNNIVNTVRLRDVCSYHDIYEPLEVDVPAQKWQLPNTSLIPIPSVASSKSVPMPKHLPDRNDLVTQILPINPYANDNGTAYSTFFPSIQPPPYSKSHSILSIESGHQQPTHKLDRKHEIADTRTGSFKRKRKDSRVSTSSAIATDINTSSNPWPPTVFYSSSHAPSSVHRSRWEHAPSSRKHHGTYTETRSFDVTSPSPIKRRRTRYEDYSPAYPSPYQYPTVPSSSSSQRTPMTNSMVSSEHNLSPKSSYAPTYNSSCTPSYIPHVPSCTMGLMEFTIDFSYTNNTPEDVARFLRQYKKARAKTKDREMVMETATEGRMGNRGLQRRLSLTSNI